MEEMTISEFKATCLKVIERVRRTGQQLLVTKNGEPAALVSPPPTASATASSYFGVLADEFEITGDIVEPLGIPWDALS